MLARGYNLFIHLISAETFNNRSDEKLDVTSSRDSLPHCKESGEKKNTDVNARSRIRAFCPQPLWSMIAAFLVSIRPDIPTPGCVRGKTDRVDRSCSLEVSMDFFEPSDEVGNSFQRFNNFFEFLKIYVYMISTMTVKRQYYTRMHTH